MTPRRLLPRRVAVSLVGVALALAVVPAGASATATLTESISDTQAGTTGAPAPVTAKSTFAVTPAFPGSGKALSSATLEFGPGFSIGGNPGDPTCGSTQILSDESRCPLGSQVGTGSMALEVLGLTQNLHVTAFNAPDGSLDLLATGSSPLNVRSVLTSTLTAGAVTVGVPPDLAQPAPGAYTSLDGFTLTLSRGASTPNSWVRTTACSGSWTTTATIMAADASSVFAQAVTPCTQGAGGGSGTSLPVAHTGSALVDSSSVSLRGTVDRSGAPTLYAFEWGPTTAYGQQTLVDVLENGSGDQPVAAGLPAAQLFDGVTYHYRLVAVNAGGTSDGEDATFVAAGSQHDSTPPQIAITTPAASQHFALGATVSAVFACDDAGGSGVASCSGPASVDTASAGSHSFTVGAADFAGNSTSKSVAYVVDPPAGSAAAVGVPRLVSTKVRVRRGSAVLRLRCKASVACTSKALLRTAGKGRRIAVGRFAFSIEPGAAKTVRIHVSKRVRSLLKRRHGRLKLTLLITPTGAKQPARAIALTLRGR